MSNLQQCWKTAPISSKLYQQIVIFVLWHPGLVRFPKLPFPETIKLQIRGFFYAWKNHRMCLHEVKFCKALWLQVHEALWFNCKCQQSSESRCFLCTKYEPLLRSLRRKHHAPASQNFQSKANNMKIVQHVLDTRKVHRLATLCTEQSSVKVVPHKIVNLGKCMSTSRTEVFA